MPILRYCIQCKDVVSGEIGTFAYDDSKTPDGNIGFVAISPVFNDLVKFYAWAHSNGWKSQPGQMDLIMYSMNG